LAGSPFNGWEQAIAPNFNARLPKLRPKIHLRLDLETLGLSGEIKAENLEYKENVVMLDSALTVKRMPPYQYPLQSPMKTPDLVIRNSVSGRLGNRRSESRTIVRDHIPPVTLLQVLPPSLLVKMPGLKSFNQSSPIVNERA